MHSSGSSGLLRSPILTCARHGPDRAGRAPDSTTATVGASIEQQVRQFLQAERSSTRLEVAASILFDDLRRFDDEALVRSDASSESRLQSMASVLRAVALLRDRYAAASSQLNVQGTNLRFRLTDRQAQVLRQLLYGQSEKEIAQQLGLSQHTVHVHVKGIYRKLIVGSRSELMSRFLHDQPKAFDSARDDGAFETSGKACCSQAPYARFTNASSVQPAMASEQMS